MPFCLFQNDLTGEHSCVMLKTLAEESEAEQGAWLAAFWKGASEWKGAGGLMRGEGGLPAPDWRHPQISAGAS